MKNVYHRCSTFRTRAKEMLFGNIKATFWIAAIVAGTVLFQQCKDPELTYTTTDEFVITHYFEKNPEQFSKFLEILRLSGNAGFLGAYGTYTCFAPTNDAIDLYLNRHNVAAVDQLSTEELKKIVRFHVVEDTISTSRFTDGKLETPTMYGQYLITGAANTGGTSYIRVNRQANIIGNNIRANNGIIHVIDNVLEPASLTLAEIVDGDPNYSIFTQALKATGWYDLLKTLELNTDGSRKFYTLIAQKDEVFNKAGFDTFEELKDRYATLDDPTNPEDSLFLFVAYRILPDIKYLADLITAPSHQTRAPLEVVTARLDGINVLLNSDLFRGVREPGSMLVREESDYAATNGVLHSADSNFTIKVRSPYTVYFDVGDQPELRRMVNIFRKPGQSAVFTQGTLKDVTWGGSSTATITYACSGIADPFYQWWVYGDVFTMQLRTGVVPWIEFTTPLLVKGKYQVWIGYRVVNSNDWQAFFDNEPLPRIFGGNPTASYPSALSEDDAKAQGWKIYQVPTDGVFPTATGSGNNYRVTARLLGTIDVTITDRHKFKVQALTNRNGGGANANCWIDMVQFIPVDKDQLWPKFKTSTPNDGTMVDYWPQ
jgi:uncharacterized surface protein with fasciclin (FAS1) repeats